MVSKEKLASYFQNIDEDKRQFALDALDEYVYYVERFKELKNLPLIRVDRKNPERQQITPAARQLKDYSQAIDAKRKTLLMILYRGESTAADELEAKLKEFK